MLKSFKEQASEDHLDLFIACLEWSLDLEDQEEVKMVPVSLASRIIKDAKGEAYHKHEPPSTVEVTDKRVALLRGWFERSRLLLIPVYCERFAKSPQHYTLLSVEKVDHELGVKVEYYDSMKRTHAACLSNARTFLQRLDLDVKLVETTRNTATQKEVECGWMVCHYLEELSRRAVGQPKQSQGWPTAQRLSKIVDYLKSMITTLEKDRMAWVKELAKEEEEAKLEGQLRRRLASS